jgi:Ca2+-binding EF-hand superfamily protein
MSPTRQRKFAHLFRLFDSDRDGRMGVDDMLRVAGRLADGQGLAADSEGRRTLLETFRAGWNLGQAVSGIQDATVTLDQFVQTQDAMFSNRDRFEELLRPMFDGVFNVMDANGDGSVSPDEYRIFLSAYGVDPAWAVQTFPRLDLNDDGRLSKQEVFILLSDYLLSDDESAVGNALYGPLD